MAREVRPRLWSFFFVFALVACKALAEEKIQTIYVHNEENINLGNVHEPLEEVTNCTLTDNHGKQFMLYPGKSDRSKEEAEEYNRFKPVYYNKRCQYLVYKMISNDSGIWKMEMTLNKTSGIETETSLYNVKVRKIYEEKSSNPPQKINVYPNQQVSIHFNEEFINLESCKLISPGKIEYSLGSEKAVEIKKLGKCGVKLFTKPEYAGIWTLIADLDNNTAYAIAYDVVIKDEKDLKMNQTQLLLKRFEQGNIEGEKLNNIRICIIEDPHGVQQPMQTGSCNYKIQSVTEHHEGVWKIYYGLEGYQNLVKQEIVVDTYGVSAFNGSVSYKSNGDISLLCQVRGRDLKFCGFVRPDGEILHMTYGVGNEKYEYYGESLNIREGYRYDQNYDCGITIRNVSSTDYGAWRCLLKFQSSKIPLGKVLKVKPLGINSNVMEEKRNITTKDVYVKRGDSYEVKCVADEVLNYCWLRSPNGTIYSVYQGEDTRALNEERSVGLKLGECGVFIEQANETDDGLWTCHLGILDGPEIQASFNVIVKDTHLMAAQHEVSLQSNGDTDLICQPLPESNWVIEACRWINPLGNGINVDLKGRYFTEVKSTHCRLSIQDPDPNVDVGLWSCYARVIMEGSMNHMDSQEVGAHMTVTGYRHFGMGSANAGLIMGLLICSCLAVCLILFQRYKLRLKQSDEEIILDKSTGFA